MQNLNSFLLKSYCEHPAFSFNQPSLECPDNAFSFNRGYEVASQFGSTLDAASRKAIQNDLLNSINAVFSVLKAQSIDEYETYFFCELNTECVRLLNEELRWYFRRHREGLANLTDEDVRSYAVQLSLQRYYFGCLSPEVVEDLRNLAHPMLEQFRAKAAAGRLKREELSVNSGPIVRAMCEVLTQEFSALGVLDAVSAVTGVKHHIGLACELSVPHATWWKNTIDSLQHSPKTLYAHIDESISCPKAIVYLSDVTEQNGPTGCYPGAYEGMYLNPLQEIIGKAVCSVGTRFDSPLKDYYSKSYHQSVNSEKFRRHFMRLPEHLRFNSHMGWDVLPGSELENKLSNSEVKMTGPAGTFIIFDGARLLHRGGLMDMGERIALQVVFFPAQDISFAKRAVSKVRRALSLV